MKQFFVLFLFAIILSGCATSSVNVLEQKEISKPFSKLLTIYVDGDIELRFLDSSTYNICIKTCFTDLESFELMQKSEKILASKISSSATSVIKSSEIFNSSFNSYDDFIKQTDSLDIDGILIVNRRNYTHSDIPLVPTAGPGPKGYTGGVSMLNTSYKCYLFKTHSFITTWVAQFDIKGERYSGKASLRSLMADKLKKNLADARYIGR